MKLIVYIMVAVMFLYNRFALSQDCQTKSLDENTTISECWEIIERNEAEYKKDLQKILSSLEGKFLSGKELQGLTQKSQEAYNQRVLEATRCILLRPSISENDFLRAFELYSRILTGVSINEEARAEGILFLIKSMESFISSESISDESLLAGIDYHLR